MNLLKVDGKIRYSDLIPCVLIPLLIGVLSSTLAKNSMQVYGSIELPKYAPPGYLFPIVWTALYLLMGLAAYRAKTKGITFKDKGSRSYFLSLVANFLWLLLFFKLNSPILAFFDALILTILVALTCAEYKKWDKPAAYMLVPYVIWMIYICALNVSFIKI